jgi:hypothetical protein
MTACQVSGRWRYWFYIKDGKEIHLSPQQTDGAVEYIPCQAEPLPCNPSLHPPWFVLWVEDANLPLPLRCENWFEFIFKHGKPLHVIWSVGVVPVHNGSELVRGQLCTQQLKLIGLTISQINPGRRRYRPRWSPPLFHFVGTHEDGI